LNKVRTFLSLNINNTLKEKVSEYQADVKKALADYDIKWENPEKFHLTLRFLGDVFEDTLNKLSQDLEKTEFEFDKISFTSDSIDFFPNKRKPNVIFLGLKETKNYSEVLTNEIDRVIPKYGINPDKKFVPHLTFGRFRKENRKGIEEKIFPIIEHINFEFGSFYLMKSIMDFRGSQYFVLKEFLFKNKK
jgi:2'-5' RNA ligase